jgi:type IV pilus assembly protein PilA
MKKISKSKKGFTLVEMVLVIAIILILAVVILIGVGSILEKTKEATSAVDSHNASTNAVLAEIGGTM